MTTERTTASQTQTPKRTSPFSVFRRRNFSLMWAGQFVETIGCALTSLAASILVYRETGGSALSVALMLMASVAPSLLIGLLAGVFVDRYDRRRIMIAADVLRGVLVAVIPFLAPYGIGWLYAIVMLISAIGQFFDPAWESVLPEVAPDEELAAANSLMAISSFGSTAIGFAASGLIASSASIDFAFYLNAFAYLFSAGCIALIQVRKVETTDKTSVAVVIRNLKFGIETLVRNPVLRSVFALAIPGALAIGMINSLLLPFATRALNANEFEYGLQEGLTSIGFVVGSLLMAKYFDRWREGQWVVVGLLSMALMGVIYSQVRSIPLAFSLQAAAGFMNAPYAIARRLLLQRNTKAEVRGRVTSAYFVAANLFSLAGMGIAGLADVIDVRLLYMAAALLLAGCGAWALVLPGLGQPAAEWRRALALLRTAPVAAGLGAVRMPLPDDVDVLVGLVPSLGGVGKPARDQIVTRGRVLDVAPETRVVTAGEPDDSAYFILSGKAVAGVAGGPAGYHTLSTMDAGDYFGEIAALTGAARTADVVVEETTRLLQVPADLLREMMGQPDFSRMVLRRMSERLARTSIRDLPRFGGVDPQALRELREEAAAQPRVEAAAA